MNADTPIPVPPPALSPLFETLRHHGIRPVLVGGFVRDALLGIENKDIDIECYGAESLDALLPLLRDFGSVNAVGRSFGVVKLKLGETEIDLSLPRTERKTAKGHRGFEVETFGELDFATAARRRDFTINAIGFDPLHGTLLDPYGGIGDLREKRLRCVDPETFTEDPLRLLRAVQFAARFTLTPDKRLLTLAHTMVHAGALDELPRERIFGEFGKLLLKAEKPSIGFRVMDAMHITPFFPELHALKQVPQEPANHPEGDVWEHTLLAVDAMARLLRQTEGPRMDLMLGILCHDLGKPLCTRLDGGRITAPGHENLGLTPANELLTRLTGDKTLIEKVLTLVRWHGTPKRLFKNHASDGEIRRLATAVSIPDILRIAEADHFGRGGEPGPFEAGEWLREKAKALGVYDGPLPPLVTGKMLVAAGLPPSKTFGTILDAAYGAQLDGAFETEEEAEKWLADYLRDFGKS
jgi:tRNA nucleotidyltransferase (CCA-adding enzyme)